MVFFCSRALFLGRFTLLIWPGQNAPVATTPAKNLHSPLQPLFFTHPKKKETNRNQSLLEDYKETNPPILQSLLAFGGTNPPIRIPEDYTARVFLDLRDPGKAYPALSTCIARELTATSQVSRRCGLGGCFGLGKKSGSYEEKGDKTLKK